MPRCLGAQCTKAVGGSADRGCGLRTQRLWAPPSAAPTASPCCGRPRTQRPDDRRCARRPDGEFPSYTTTLNTKLQAVTVGLYCETLPLPALRSAWLFPWQKRFALPVQAPAQYSGGPGHAPAPYPASTEKTAGANRFTCAVTSLRRHSHRHALQSTRTGWQFLSGRHCL